MSGIYHEWNGTTLTITSDSGTSSADLKGEMGVRGPQGVAGNIEGVSYFGVPYSSADKVIELAEGIIMYLFTTPTGYDAVIEGAGVIPDYELEVEHYLYFDVEKPIRPFDGEKIERLYISGGITSIGNYFMYRAFNLKVLVFANSNAITHLGDYAFARTSISGEFSFTGLQDTYIRSVFKSCPNLEGLTLGGKITSIKSYSFRGCISLRYVRNIAPAGAELTISYAAFYYCPSVEILDVEPANTILGNWTLMFVPMEAKTESGVLLGSATWKEQGRMNFVYKDWTEEQLTAMRSVKGETTQLHIPVSDTQGTDENSAYNPFAFQVEKEDGTIEPKRYHYPARGACGIFTTFHTHNIINPNKPYKTFKDFIEKGIAPNKIEITQEVYDTFSNHPVGQAFINSPYIETDFTPGTKASIYDLPVALEADLWGQEGTVFWGICQVLGWDFENIRFKNGTENTAEEKVNCGAEVKQVLLDNLAAGKPVFISCVGAAVPEESAHSVVALGYDANTDKFMIIDSTGDFPAQVSPLVYWVNFENFITPNGNSRITTFDFGEGITMTNIDNKLNTVLENLQYNFRTASGTLYFSSDVVPTSGNTLTQHINCPNGAKVFVIEPDATVEADIRNRTDKNYTLWFRGSFIGTDDEDLDGLLYAYMGQYKQVGYAGQSITNTNGIDFTCFTLAKGTWNWTAYYWNE